MASSYRLCSPFEGSKTAFMSVSEDRREAVVTHVYGPAEPNRQPVLLPLRGLDAEKEYRDVESGRVYGGDELMTHRTDHSPRMGRLYGHSIPFGGGGLIPLS